jgi:hypothetical protein
MDDILCTRSVFGILFGHVQDHSVFNMLILDKGTLFVYFTMAVQRTEDLGALHACFYFVTDFIEDKAQ